MLTPATFEAAFVWRFYLFGGMRIYYTDQCIDTLPYRVINLLAFLLLNPRPMSRVHLCGLLYPDHPEEYGRRRISAMLWSLRKILSELPLDATKEYISKSPSSRWRNVEAFHRLCKHNEPESMRAALNLYHRDLLPENSAEWILLEQESLKISSLIARFISIQ